MMQGVSECSRMRKRKTLKRYSLIFIHRNNLFLVQNKISSKHQDIL